MQACELQTHSAEVTLHSAPWSGMHDAAIVALAKGTELTLKQDTIVEKSETPHRDEFPGLYSYNLAASLFPANPFLSAQPDCPAICSAEWEI